MWNRNNNLILGCDQKGDGNEVEEIAKALGQREFAWILALVLKSTVILAHYSNLGQSLSFHLIRGGGMEQTTPKTVS